MLLFSVQSLANHYLGLVRYSDGLYEGTVERCNKLTSITVSMKSLLHNVCYNVRSNETDDVIMPVDTHLP